MTNNPNPLANFKGLGMGAKGLGLIGVAMLTALAACGDDARKIPNAPRYGLDGVDAAVATQSPALALPTPSAADWPTHLGSNSHVQNHGVFDGTPGLVVRYNLGAMPRGAAIGAATPIEANGIVYHYDAAGRLHAVGLDGARRWVISLVPIDGQTGDGFGGGIAYQGGRLYVSTGYGEVVAVDAATGGILWRYYNDAPLRRAPIVADGRVIAIARNSETIALDAVTGIAVWRHFGTSATAPGRLNSGVPASANGRAVIAYATGGVASVATGTGQENWAVVTAGDAFTGQSSVFGEVSGDPVILGNQVILATRSGIQSRDLGTGGLNWTSSLGSGGAVIAMGNSIFGISASNTLYRLNANNGSIAWSIRLPVEGGSGSFSGARTGYLDPRIANGRLLVWDNKGMMRQYNASNGSFLGVVDLNAQFAATPILANGAIIGTGEKGELLIYR